MKRHQIHQHIYVALLTACICTLPFSKWLSSVCVILIAVNWSIEGDYKNKFLTLRKNMPALLMIGSFLCTAAGLLYTSDAAACQFVIQKKLPFLALGITIGSISVFNINNVKRLLYYYTAALFIASVYCFLAALYLFRSDHSIDHLFYHSLGGPIHFHAVYFSVWIFIALFFVIIEILFEELSASRRRILLVAFCWFGIFLILLSSKLVIIIFLLSLMAVLGFNFKRSYSTKPLLIAGVIILIAAAAVLSTKNTISKRFDDIRGQQVAMLSGQPKDLNATTHFNGLSLRILLWRFGLDLVNENHAQTIGVSAGDAQRRLNEKIVKAHMYTGEPNGKDQGYLNYNFHNQFIETYVQSGAVGLLFLMSLFAALFYTAVRNRDILFTLFLLIFICFFCTESVLETQKGVIPFVLFALIFSGQYIAGSRTPSIK